MKQGFLYLGSFSCVIFSIFLPTEPLRCLNCVTTANAKCNSDAEFTSIMCAPSTRGCFTLVLKQTGEGHRGCAEQTNYRWRTSCQNQTEFACTLCTTDNCNDLVFTRNATQKCVVCRGDECRTKTELTTCPNKVYHSNPQFCYYYLDKRTVVDKGCGDGSRANPPEHGMSIVCQGMGCNMELPNTYSACIVYEGKPSLYSRNRNLLTCHNTSSHFWHPGCYHISPIKQQRVSAGCLSSLEPRTAKLCTKPDYKYHCQYCAGDECNSLQPNAYNFSNVCEEAADHNNLRYCSGLRTRCFVSWLRINYTTSNNQFGTKLQMYAGCVEPGHNQFFSMSHETHYCDNFRSTKVPCLSVKDDFSKRFSCYVCSNCENVYELDYTVKHLCPEGTKQCYQVMARDGRVRRGCVHTSDVYIGVCNTYKHVCHKCDHKYCNHNRVAKSPVHTMCYKTRPHNTKYHLMTMRLENCMGASFLKLWPDCYVAERPGHFIEAGCINELEAADNVRHQMLFKGSLGIIFRDQLFCYNCISNHTDFCYNVRHLQPKQCLYQHQYAIRGCYTLIQRNSIQRGCLSELDMYYQKLCVTKNFEEVCIVCTRNYCNIDDPS